MQAVAVSGDEPPNGPRLVLDNGRSYEVGDDVGPVIEGMAGPWDDVVVTSPALVKAQHLHPKSKGASRSEDPVGPGMRVSIRSDIAPGNYPVTATLNGKTVATAQMKVVAQRPAEIRRFAIEPRDKKVRPGESVVVVLSDDHAAPDEDSVAVNSPAFEGSQRIKVDSPDDPACKCDDGATVYAARITVSKGTGTGTYRVTAVSHHGRTVSVAKLTVAGDEKGSGAWVLWSFVGGTGSAVVAAGACLAVSSRRRRAEVGSD
ncbi:hypothetical protein ACQEVS_25615 [Streptomyces sp. CA-181903]|uniref:hypothetical protein n=1 Tax=Streptomyces sp. CA-181903 TaxID=3240055 RepID=UPI003D942657